MGVYLLRCRVEGRGQTEGVGFVLPHWVQAVRLGGSCRYQLGRHFSPIFGFLLKHEKQTKAWTVVKE